jgi:hypothetical protein
MKLEVQNLIRRWKLCKRGHSQSGQCHPHSSASFATSEDNPIVSPSAMYNPQNNNPNAGIPPELQSMIMNYSGQPSVADPQQQLYIQAMLLQQQQQQQQQQQSGSTSPYDSPQIQRAKSGAADSYGSASSSPSLHNLPQRFGSPLANQQPMTSPQQAKAQKDEQARRQSANTPRQRSVSVPNSNDSSMANDTALSVKRVSAVR